MTTERDRQNQLDYARKVAETKGREKGLEEGRKEGRKQANVQTASNLLSLGVPVDTIAKATGLSEQEVRELA